jgi:hypothetical protein
MVELGSRTVTWLGVRGVSLALPPPQRQAPVLPHGYGLVVVPLSLSLRRGGLTCCHVAQGLWWLPRFCLPVEAASHATTWLWAYGGFLLSPPLRTSGLTC